MKEKIKILIEQIYNLTISGELIWEVSSSTKWSKWLKALGEDGTKFELEVKWVVSTDSLKLDNSYLFIRNSDIPGGLYCCNYTIYDDISKLRDFLVEKYCSDLSPTIEDLSSVFDKISINMNKEAWREKQINNIIN